MRRVKLTRLEIWWQAIVFTAISISVIETPLSLVFNRSVEKWHLILESFIVVVMIVDFISNIKMRKRLRKQMKKRFHFVYKDRKSWIDLSVIVDICSCVPIDLILYPFGLYSWIRYARFFKMVRTLKIINMIRYIGGFTILPRLLKFQFTVMCAIIAINWIACGWIFIYPQVDGGDIYTYYNKALYWAITTLTTIGYGDITPTSNIGRLYTMVIMFLGVGVYGVVIGNVSRMISMADRYKEQTREKMHELNIFMRYYNIPDQLQYTVFSYYNHLFTKRLSDNDVKIISELPNALQSELQTYMNMKLISNVPAFKECTHNCLKDIASSLKQEYYSPREIITKRGEVGNEMFIVAHGVVDVVVKGKGVISTMTDGQCFGESALLEESKRNSDVVAQTYCDLYRLDKENFVEIIRKHPDLLKSMKRVMAKRVSDRKS
ncbi:MAG: cyclic nucleotide-binding domain-containing protein [Bacteriovoracaceae bacterium]|nr:cyclic nucleotide-binding domain-containing protein [Bacteriovoracaceae bacterium]